MATPRGSTTNQNAAEPQARALRARKNESPNKAMLDLTKPQTFVTITAGHGKLVQDFVIHKSFLAHCSPFFQSAFNHSVNSGSSQNMRVPNVTREVFGLVYHWLYLPKLPSSPLEVPSLENLVKVWLAAEQFQIPALQNRASDALCDVLGEYKNSKYSHDEQAVEGVKFDEYLACIKHLYFSTPAGTNTLKNLVLDIFPHHQLSYVDRIEEFPVAFCQDISRALAKNAHVFHTRPADRKSRFKVSESSV